MSGWPAVSSDPGGTDLPVRREKRPFFAAFLSLLFVGLGQVYNGRLGKGFLILFSILLVTRLFLLPGILIWLYGIYDAYATAQQMNTGATSFADTSMAAVVIFMIAWTLSALLLGLMALGALLSQGIGLMA